MDEQYLLFAGFFFLKERRDRLISWIFKCQFCKDYVHIFEIVVGLKNESNNFVVSLFVRKVCCIFLVGILTEHW